MEIPSLCEQNEVSPPHVGENVEKERERRD